MALDAVIARQNPGVLDHFYAQFDRCDLSGIAAEAAGWMARSAPFLDAFLIRFAQARFLYSYADPSGLADALHRTCVRGGVPGFPRPEDRQTLAAVFAAYLPDAAQIAPALWAAARGAGERVPVVE